VGGTLRPSALATFRLIANSNLVGACTGRSPAFHLNPPICLPFKIRGR
jgi:hypothetical protein